MNNGCDLLSTNFKSDVTLYVGFQSTLKTDNLKFINPQGSTYKKFNTILTANRETRNPWCTFDYQGESCCVRTETDEQSAPTVLLWKFLSVTGSICREEVPYQRSFKPTLNIEQQLSFIQKYANELIINKAGGDCLVSEKPASNRLFAIMTFQIRGLYGYAVLNVARTSRASLSSKSGSVFCNPACRSILMTDAWISISAGTSTANSVSQPSFLFIQGNVYNKIAGILSVPEDDMENIKSRFQTVDANLDVQSMQFLWRVRKERREDMVNLGTTIEIDKLNLQYETKLASLGIAPPIFIMIENDGRSLPTMSLTLRSVPASTLFSPKLTNGEVYPSCGTLPGSSDSAQPRARGIPDLLMYEVFDLLVRMGTYSDVDFSVDDFGINVQDVPTVCKEEKENEKELFSIVLEKIRKKAIANRIPEEKLFEALFVNIFSIVTLCFLNFGEIGGITSIGQLLAMEFTRFLFGTIVYLQESIATALVGKFSHILRKINSQDYYAIKEKFDAIVTSVLTIEVFTDFLKPNLGTFQTTMYPRKGEVAKQSLEITKLCIDQYNFWGRFKWDKICQIVQVMMLLYDRLYQSSLSDADDLKYMRERLTFEFEFEPSTKKVTFETPNAKQEIHDSKVQLYKLDVDCTKNVNLACYHESVTYNTRGDSTTSSGKTVSTRSTSHSTMYTFLFGDDDE